MSKILLSICMMVKNEESNLRRCLNSLKTLRGEISSELIIVDTGSTDSTVTIAKEFTNKVFYQKWGNDFAAMRNITIDYATGEWVFIIDADEELIKDEGIIDFFKKKIPLNVVAGIVEVKNFTSSQISQERYTVSLKSARLFRKKKDFHYKGIVHNIPVVNGDLIELSAILLHYGYISDDKELMEKKFQRTATLLQEKLNAEPDNIYYWFQLANSFAMHGDHLESLQTIQKAYGLCKNDKDLYEHIYVVGMLLKEALANQYTSDEILKAVQRGLFLEPEYFDLYFFLAQFYAMRHEYDKALKCFEKYFVIVNNYENTQIKYNLTLNHYSLHSQKEAIYNIAAIYGRMEQYKEANQKIAELLVDEKIIIEIGKPFLDLVRICSFKINEFENILKLYNFLTLAHINKEDYELILEKDWIDATQEAKKQFVETMKNAEGDYGELNYLRSIDIAEWKDKEVSIAKRLLSKDDFSEHYWYSWLGVAYWEQEMANQIIDHSSEKNILSLFTYLDRVAKAELIKICQVCLDKLGRSHEYSYYTVKRGKLFAKYLLFSQEWKEEYENLFSQYTRYGMAHLKMLYTSFVIDHELVYEMKSVEEAFLAYLILAENKEVNEKVDFLKKAAKVFPEMGKGIRLALGEIAAKTPDQKARDLEMEELKKTLLENIIKLVEGNKYSEALQAIAEVEKIVGVDAEILMLKTKILTDEQ